MAKTLDTDRRGMKYANKGGSATAGRGFDKHADQRLTDWLTGYALWREQEFEATLQKYKRHA